MSSHHQYDPAVVQQYSQSAVCDGGLELAFQNGISTWRTARLQATAALGPGLQVCFGTWKGVGWGTRASGPPCHAPNLDWSLVEILKNYKCFSTVVSSHRMDMWLLSLVVCPWERFMRSNKYHFNNIQQGPIPDLRAFLALYKKENSQQF